MDECAAIGVRRSLPPDPDTVWVSYNLEPTSYADQLLTTNGSVPVNINDRIIVQIFDEAYLTESLNIELEGQIEINLRVLSRGVISEPSSFLLDATGVSSVFPPISVR